MAQDVLVGSLYPEVVANVPVHHVGAEKISFDLHSCSALLVSAKLSHRLGAHDAPSDSCRALRALGSGVFELNPVFVLFAQSAGILPQQSVTAEKALDGREVLHFSLRSLYLSFPLLLDPLVLLLIAKGEALYTLRTHAFIHRRYDEFLFDGVYPQLLPLLSTSRLYLSRSSSFWVLSMSTNQSTLLTILTNQRR